MARTCHYRTPRVVMGRGSHLTYVVHAKLQFKFARVYTCTTILSMHPCTVRVLKFRTPPFWQFTMQHCADTRVACALYPAKYVDVVGHSDWACTKHMHHKRKNTSDMASPHFLGAWSIDVISSCVVHFSDCIPRSCGARLAVRHATNNTQS